MKSTNKLYATTIWMIVLALLSGIVKIVFYQVDMYYSKLAPQQVDNDAAYSLMKFQGPLENIIWIVYALFALLIVRKIIKVWSASDKEKVTEETKSS